MPSQPIPPAAQTRFFDALAAALVVGLLVAVIVGLAGIQGPGWFTGGQVTVVGGLALFVVAAVLFIHIATVRRTLEGVRILLANELEHAGQQERGAQPTIAQGEAAPVPEQPSSSPSAGQAATLSAEEEKQHVITIEGIGERMATRLNHNGIITIPQLLRADPEQVAKQIDAMPLVVREWQWMGDMMRVKGVGPQTAELLVRCGIHSVEDLAAAKPEDIVAESQRLKQSRKVRITGSEVGIGGAKRWIDGAKQQVGAGVALRDRGGPEAVTPAH